MKRQTQTGIATRVYSYGAVPARVAPPINEDGAIGQMKVANRLWNVLVAVERARRARYLLIMHDEEQGRIDALRGRMDELRQEIKARRKEKRARSANVADLTAALAGIRGQAAALIEARKATHAQRHADRKAQLDACQEASYRRVKRARQAAASMGLFWGTYNDIVQRADSARKLGGELRFRGFRGSGTLTAQIMGGAAVDRCCGRIAAETGDAVEASHTFFRIDPPDAKRKWRYAYMRIGSNPDRSPIWCAIPIVYHRDLPADADIKSISFSRRQSGREVRWQLNVTVNVPAAPPKPGPMIAIDLGWRLLPEGVRVAYWQDDRGRSGQVLVPGADIAQFEQVRSLRSLCDRKREEYLPALAAWLDGKSLEGEWAQRTAHIAQWRSPDRLERLIAWWRDHRMEGDAEAYEAAHEWRRGYMHLANWWRNLQEQLTSRVRERYRIFGARVARDYGTVVLELFDLREAAAKPLPEEERAPNYSGGQRQMVAPSVLRAALVNACKRDGVRVVELPAEYTTRECHVCHSVLEWNQAESVMHRCVKCQTLFDQDQNACANLLRLGSRASAGDLAGSRA